MTQDLPPSWPPRGPGRSGTRPLAVDPITGELIETDGPPGGEFWVPAAGTGHPAPGPAAADPPRADGGYPGQPAVEPPPAYPAGFPAQAGYPPPAFPPAAYGPAPYGYPGAPGWGPPYGVAAARPTNGMAVASVVLGAVWMLWIGSALALVFGYVARNQIRRTGEGGDGLALAGIIMGWVGMGMLALTLVIVALDGSS